MDVSVSIITLTKNRAPLLRLCLQSLVGQLKRDDELIVLDNASTDNTRDVVNSFKRFFTIRYFMTDVQGYPKLYNTAVSKSAKKIIVFLDDDCIAGKNFVSHVRRVHDEQNAARVAQGRTISIPRGNIYVDVMGDHYVNWISANTTSAPFMRTFDNKNASMPRSVWLASGGFPQQLSVGSEDIELGLRLRRKGVQIVYDPSIVAYHHERKTFAGFVDQHRRIAMSEALLALRAPGADSLREVYIKKIILHIQSAVRRELFYLTSFQITYFFMLPCLYIVLAVVRVWTYHMTTWTHQK